MSITLSYPAYAEEFTSTIVLPSPQLTDNKGSKFETVAHITRDSNFKILVRTNRNNVYNTTLEFANLCSDDAESFEAFILAAQGHYFLYTDYEDNDWICIPIEDTFELVATGMGPVYSATLSINRWEAE